MIFTSQAKLEINQIYDEKSKPNFSMYVHGRYEPKFRFKVIRECSREEYLNDMLEQGFKNPEIREFFYEIHAD